MRHLSRSLLLVVMALALLVSGHGGHALVPGMGSMMMTAPAIATSHGDHHGHAGHAMAAAALDTVDPGAAHPDDPQQSAGDHCASISCGIVMLESVSFNPRTSVMRPLSHAIQTGQVPAGLSPTLPERPPRA